MRALMERTRPAPVAAHTLQAHVLADDLHDVGILANAFDVLVGDHVTKRSVVT